MKSEPKSENVKTVGIGDIAVYVPEQRIDLTELSEYRVRTIPTLERHFQRALRTTGQRAIRFPYFWEDSATMAAEAARDLLTRHREQIGRLRYLVAGTESGLDHSKPVSAYVQGILRSGGFAVPDGIASYQMQHACAGATAGVLSTAALLAVSAESDEIGVVTASDVARYEGKSTAEVTQGAGAAAVLIETNPALIELDVHSPGFCSQDVDDFFRPLGSVTARVQGQFSMQCYRNNLDGALVDYARRHGATVGEVLLNTDYFVLHAPFRNMPAIALEAMFERHAGMDSARARDRLDAGGFFRALEPIAETGNTYTASVYINLASLLLDRYREIGQAIVGKSILIGSYGSGSTMILLGGTISERAPEVIESWPSELVRTGIEADLEAYERWMSIEPEPQRGAGIEVAAAGPDLRIPKNAFYRKAIRADGYREYATAADPSIIAGGTSTAKSDAAGVEPSIVAPAVVATGKDRLDESASVQSERSSTGNSLRPAYPSSIR